MATEERGVRGADILLEVEVDGALVQLGGQRGATVNLTSEPLDATSKTTDGWYDYITGMKEWSIDCDGLVLESDTAYAYLEDAYFNDKTVKASVGLPSGTVYEGDIIVTEFPIEAPYDDLATYSATLQGAGALTKK